MYNNNYTSNIPFLKHFMLIIIMVMSNFVNHFHFAVDKFFNSIYISYVQAKNGPFYLIIFWIFLNSKMSRTVWVLNVIFCLLDFTKLSHLFYKYISSRSTSKTNSNSIHQRPHSIFERKGHVIDSLDFHISDTISFSWMCWMCGKLAKFSLMCDNRIEPVWSCFWGDEHFVSV